MTSPDDPELLNDITIRVRAINTPDWPVAVRLRLLLKYALRSLRLRCTYIAPLPDDDQAEPPGAAPIADAAGPPS